MLCYKSEDALLEKLYPYPFGKRQSFKKLHQVPNVPIVSTSHNMNFVLLYVPFDGEGMEEGRPIYIPLRNVKFVCVFMKYSFELIASDSLNFEIRFGGLFSFSPFNIFSFHRGSIVQNNSFIS